MAYQRKVWESGDTITSGLLNNIESGIVGLESALTETEQRINSTVAAQGKFTEPYELHKGYSGDCANVGKWVQFTDNFQYVIIPIHPYDIVEITSPTDMPYGFLHSYTAPTEEGETVDYSAEPGFEARLTTSVAAPGRLWVAPRDANYLYIQVIRRGEDKTPTSLKINGVEYIKSAVATVAKESIDALALSDIVPLSGRREYFGSAANATWGAVANTYRFVVIPCRPGASIIVRANASTRIAAFTELPAPSLGNKVPLSAETDWTAQITINSSASFEGTAPSDIKYLMVATWLNGNDCTPRSVVIDGIEYASTVYDNLKAYCDEQKKNDVVSSAMTGQDITLTWEQGTVNTPAVGTPLSNTPNTTQAPYKHRKRTTGGVMRYPYPLTLRTTSIDGIGFQTRLLFVDENDDYVKAIQPSMYPKYIPANQGFRIALSPYPNDALQITDETDITSRSDAEVNARVVLHRTGLFESQIRWAALGDSITEGYASYFYDDNGEQAAAYDKNYSVDCWAQKVSLMNDWQLTNFAIGGTGFIHWEGGGRVYTQAGFRRARAIDFSPYNLVTVSFGVNDWKGNKPLGTIDDSFGSVNGIDQNTGLPAWDGEPTTIYGGIKAVIAAIMQTNPLCRVVVTTPLNCRGYNYIYKDSERYGLTYYYNNSMTLEDVYQAIVDVCELYGIQYIDLTHKSPINMFNIVEALPDGVHPSLEAHAVLAEYMAGALKGTISGDSSFQPMYKKIKQAAELAHLPTKGETDIASIQEIAASGRADLVFEIGQVFYMPWTDKSGSNAVTYQAPVVLTHIGEAVDGAGKKHRNAMFFQWMYTTPASKVFSEAGNNDYSQSDVLTWLNDSTDGFLAGVTEDWQNAMKTVRVKTLKGSNGTATSATTVDEKVFLPSVVEVYGVQAGTIPDELKSAEGEYWEYWKQETGLSDPSNDANEARVHTRISSQAGNVVDIMLRSANLSDATKQYIMRSSAGDITHAGNTTSSRYVTPCFVIY